MYTLFIVLGIVGILLCLYNRCSLFNLGLSVVIIYALYYFFAERVVRATMDALEPQKYGRGMWDAFSDVGGKWVDIIGANTQSVVGAISSNPDLLGKVFSQS